MLLLAASLGMHAQQKTFKAACLNVDGLPKTLASVKLNPDGKEGPGATAIGKKVKQMGYDFIGVSEDFNFHSELWNEAWNGGVDDENGFAYNATTHRGKLEATISAIAGIAVQRSPLFNTDGLCLFYKQNHVTVSGETCVAWNKHYGYTSDGADGLIDKGYRFYVVTLEDGTELDVYILHMDAETSEGDNAARKTQIIQLANAILASKNGRPIIIMGDTNCRYTRDPLKTCLIDAINADERFTIKDPWIECEKDGLYPALGSSSLMVGELGYQKGEVVDKLFYINNTESAIRIKALSYLQDITFVNEQGEPLADHWPCVAEFEYHAYDPAVDDVLEGDLESTDCYLRNKQTGYFLKAGGWWGTHAMQGDYGTKMSLTKMPDGKYVLLTPMGSLCQGDPYMNNPNNDRWTLYEKDNYYAFTYDDNGTTRALTANDPTTIPYGPNRRYVTCADYNQNDDYQKWKLLTEQDLKREMLMSYAKGVAYNCTHLIGGANFDRNDATSIAAWTFNARSNRMWYNPSDGRVDIERGNPCAEVFVNKGSSGTTQWNVSQNISSLPQTAYTVSCQAYQRISNSETTTADIHLYATSEGNEVKQMVPLMYAGAQVTDASWGATAYNGYYFPNSMAEATTYFNAGYYETSVQATVTDGQLTLGIKKTSDTGRSNTAWTCFDNFQLMTRPEATPVLTDYLVNVDGSVERISAMEIVMDGKTYLVSPAAVYEKLTPYEVTLGEVNNDAAVNIADVAGLTHLLKDEAQYVLRYDVNQDGAITVADIRALGQQVSANQTAATMTVYRVSRY